MIGGLSAGRLSHRIAIYELIDHVSTKGDVKVDDQGFPLLLDDEGFPIKKFVFKNFCYASFSPVRGREKAEKAEYDRADVAVMMADFKIRFQNISFADKIKFNDYYWDITSLAPMGRQNREVIEIRAEVIEAKRIING